MRSSSDEYPPRRPSPQQLRHHDATMALDGPPSDCRRQHQHPPQQLQPQQYAQQHQLSPEMPHPVGGAQIFALFYSLIFSVVHAALTMVFTPVLGNNSKDRRRQQTAPAVSSPRSLLPPRQSESNIIMRESDDPEMAMVDIISGGDGSSYHQPILKSQSSTSSSRSSRSGSYVLSSVDENKVVRFPGQGRARPPLGRIDRLSSLSSVSSVGSTSSSSTLSSSSSRNNIGGRRERSRPASAQHLNTTLSSRSSFSRSGPVPRISSPFGRMTSPRMTHSTYFLE
ncbi:hypothetical protein ACHAWU_008053 [Discostella pseudostelligera]|uniref:Uncharacterized protein n=1 Tax=Discostella pseudostelligera TaxID=259834 RepID=A0ABD3NAJ3_9STRA